jgi:ATP-dependent DNA helicase RecQ
MPKDIESWYQEMGRAGRDGVDSDCVLFYSWADVKLHEYFLNEIEDPDLWHAKRQATVDLFELLEAGRCRHQALLRHFDEEMPPCGTSCDVCTGVSTEEMAAAAMVGMTKIRKPGSRDRSNRRGERRSHGAASASSLDTQGQALFERLRVLRKELADRQNKPAYIVFSDKVLLEMAARRPQTREELLEVSGVGPAKLERYGTAFLEEIERTPG